MVGESGVIGATGWVCSAGDVAGKVGGAVVTGAVVTGAVVTGAVVGGAVGCALVGGSVVGASVAAKLAVAHPGYGA